MIGRRTAGVDQAMATNAYHFITHWRVEGSVGEVSSILGDALSLPRWWPSVYLSVEEVHAGEASGVGRDVWLHTKGWLPYTLRWGFVVTEAERPGGFSLVARGDFVGEGRWTFVQSGGWVDVTYDWRVSATKPLLRRLSWLLKPVFRANHRWAMARGEESLRLELLRRRATSLAASAIVPPPPGRSRLPLGPLAVAVAVAASSIAARRALRSRG